MKSNTTKSLENVFQGFLKISDTDKAEYLKYFALVIERTQNINERNKLVRFKSKLEKQINGNQKS